MGIVARQSFKAAIVTYFGVIMGVLNNLLIYPYMLEVSQYGEIQFVIQTATFFTPFLLFGLGGVLTKYFPEYKESEQGRAHLYGLVYAGITLNVLIFLSLFLVFKDEVISHYLDGSGVSAVSVIVLIGISALLPYINMVKFHSANFGRIAIPSFLLQLLKFFLPLVVVAYYYDYLSFEQLIYSLFLYYVVLALIFFIYGFRLDRIWPSFSLKRLRQDPKLWPMLVFSLFSVVSGVGVTLTNQVDIVMITSMKGTYANGLYTWSLFIANAIAIPYMLVSNVSIPLIAQYWKDDDRKALHLIYKQSSATLIVLTLGVFCAFWVVVDELFALMPKGAEYRLAKYVILMLVISKIIDMAAGLNSQIIAMSEKYKALLYMLGAAVLVNIGLNFILIPNYGINGSAVATIVSIVVFNVLKYSFIWHQFKMQPFSLKSFGSIALFFLCYYLVELLPRTGKAHINFILFSALTALLYFGLAYLLRLAPEMNKFVDKQLLRLGWRKDA